MAGKIKVKFSTDYRMRGKLYRQGKSYAVPTNVAGNLIWNGVAVRATRNAKNEAPEEETATVTVVDDTPTSGE